jgi:hypothetical protein
MNQSSRRLRLTIIRVALTGLSTVGLACSNNGSSDHNPAAQGAGSAMTSAPAGTSSIPGVSPTVTASSSPHAARGVPAPPSAAPAQPLPSTQATVPVPSRPTHAAPGPPRMTYTETGGNRKGSPTFSDPAHPSAAGPKVGFLQNVQVSCKVKAVPFPSVYPDGYWYRIAGSPWNNNWYSPANTFLNGDPMNGPYSHWTDFRVPDC